MPPRNETETDKRIQCGACDFTYYFNPVSATATLLVRGDGKMLFIRRAKEPRKGALAFPGGFVDEGETLEEGARRETREEVNLEVDALHFLGSAPNWYDFKNIRYPVIDAFFVAPATREVDQVQSSEVAGVEWLDPMTVNLEEIAFPSLRQAVRLYRLRRDPERPGYLLPAGTE